MNVSSQPAGGKVELVDVGDARIAVETTGAGEPVLLVHGFPHTRAIWRDVTCHLAARGFESVAVDLRGTGESTRAATGYDPPTLARDLVRVLNALGLHRVHAVGIDLGVTSVFALAATHPDRVITATFIEGVIGALPGAEGFVRNPPWWFGFHQAPGGLAERVLAGAGDVYVRHFLASGSRRGVPDDLASGIVDDYRGEESLRCAFEHYRAMPAAAAWIAKWAGGNRFDMPVLTIGGDTVGDLTARQLRPLADDFRSEVLPESGHIVCVDDPAGVASLIADRALRSAATR